MKKLISLERRLNLLKKRVCFFVHDVINKKIHPSLNDFYELKVLKINTRNNGYMVKLPKTKLEYGRYY